MQACEMIISKNAFRSCSGATTPHTEVKILYRKMNDASVKHSLRTLCNMLSIRLVISYYRTIYSDQHGRLVISWLAVAIYGRSNRSDTLVYLVYTILYFLVAFFFFFRAAGILAVHFNAPTESKSKRVGNLCRFAEEIRCATSFWNLEKRYLTF